MIVRPLIAAALSAFTLFNAGCAKPPTEPSESGIAGTWTGDASDSSGPGRMTWQIQQDVSPFSGTLQVIDTYAGYVGQGSVSGTVSGSALHFTLRIPAAGFDPPFESCTAEMTGDGLLDGATITGTYTGNISCGGAITGGQFTLARQQ